MREIVEAFIQDKDIKQTVVVESGQVQVVTSNSLLNLWTL